MKKFENGLIVREEKFECGLFPKVPKISKDNSVLILTGGIADDIIVRRNTTPKELRDGKYTKLVEVSTDSYIKEIKFCSMSKEMAYSFDVYVKAVIQVKDCLRFYRNRNIDVDAYFNNLFSMDVKKITKKYSILGFDGMDEELVSTLAAYNTTDEATGLGYQISAVYAEPGEKSQEYVQKYGQQLLNNGLKESAQKLAEGYDLSYGSAIKSAVLRGEMTELEAIERAEQHTYESIEKRMAMCQEMKGIGALTDAEVVQIGRSYIPMMQNNGARIESPKTDKNNYDKYYDEEENV